MKTGIIFSFCIMICFVSLCTECRSISTREILKKLKEYKAEKVRKELLAPSGLRRHINRALSHAEEIKHSYHIDKKLEGLKDEDIVQRLVQLIRKRLEQRNFESKENKIAQHETEQDEPTHDNKHNETQHSNEQNEPKHDNVGNAPQLNNGKNETEHDDDENKIEHNVEIETEHDHGPNETEHGHGPNETEHNHGQNEPEHNHGQNKPEQSEHQQEHHNETIQIMEGEDVVDLDSTDMPMYMTLQMLTSTTFCATPLSANAIDEIDKMLNQAAVDIISVFNNGITAVDNIEGELTKEKVTQQLKDFLVAFKKPGMRLDQVLKELVASLQRYILYGTEYHPRCPVDMPSAERMICIGIGFWQFNSFISDPFNDEHSEETATTDASPNMCNNISMMVKTLSETPKLDVIVDAIVFDMECISDKLKQVIDDEEELQEEMSEQQLEDRNIPGSGNFSNAEMVPSDTESASHETEDNKSHQVGDHILTSLKNITEVTTEILIDISGLVSTFQILSQDTPDKDADLSLINKRLFQLMEKI